MVNGSVLEEREDVNCPCGFVASPDVSEVENPAA